MAPGSPPLASLAALDGKVAIVTGSANGIGRASALRLSEAGARVCGLDLDLAGAEQTSSMLESGPGAMELQADVRRRADIEAVVDAVVTAWGRIDVVVNSAGLFPPVPLFDVDEELWDQVLNVNASGTFIVSQICARRMKDLGNPGAIVNLASKSSFQPTEGFSHYAASKGAVAMITKALALELAPHSIRVNAVAPGGVDTGTVARAGRTVDPELLAKVGARSARCPMGRTATPDEIARVVLFLASDWSSYMTGSIVLADGGFLVS